MTIIARERDGRNGAFDTLFPLISPLPCGPRTVSRLDAVAQAMADGFDATGPRARIAAVYPFFLEFVLNDIAYVDGPAFGEIDRSTFDPLARDMVVSRLSNRRNARLRLQSVYGGDGDADVDALTLSDPARPGRLRLGDTEAFGTVPRSKNDDLPRVGSFAERAEARAIDFRGMDHGDRIDPRRAVIADRRNDSHLGLAQVHAAFLRTHARIADGCDDVDILFGPPDALASWARGRLAGCYRWLIRHDLLPALGDPATLQAVVMRQAPLFRRFRQQAGTDALPLETILPLRMVIDAMMPVTLGWNRYFDNDRRVGLDDLFCMTGQASLPMNGLGEAALPSIWVPDWARLCAADDPGLRGMTASIAPALSAAMRRVRYRDDLRIADPVRRSLRLGYRLGLPSAQACLAALDTIGIAIDPLSPAELADGHTGRALVAAGFEHTTPLGFYLLKEAEMRSGGRHLGPLGTWLIADTIIGLLHEADRDQGWNAPAPPTLAGARISCLADFFHLSGAGR